MAPDPWLCVPASQRVCQCREEGRSCVDCSARRRRVRRRRAGRSRGAVHSFGTRTISMRRFLGRASSVALFATGFYSPKAGPGRLGGAKPSFLGGWGGLGGRAGGLPFPFGTSPPAPFFRL